MSGRFRFSNRASSLVAATVSSSATTVQLEAGGGAKLPLLASGDRIRATLIASTGVQENVTVTLVVGDVVTIERAQEGSAASTFPTGSRFELRITAGIADNWLQRSGDSMTGPLDMGGFPIKNPVFNGPTVFSTIHATQIRAIDTDPSLPYDPETEISAINIPPQASGQRPRYNGSTILNAAMFAGIVFDAFIDVNHVPAWFKLCDGTNGTPDLRGRFIRGWTAAFGVTGHGSKGAFMADDPFDPAGVNSSPAADYINTSIVGDHNHGGATAPKSLGPAEVPGITVSTDRRSVESGGDYTVLDHILSITHTGAGAAFAMGINPGGGHAHQVYNLPPFYVLARVMFNIP
jgi:hypothetical protein